MNFNEWTVRASQASKIMGKVGITDNQEITLKGLNDKLASGKPLTALQQVTFNDLTARKMNPELPKTAQSELRSAWRRQKYNRSFQFTNKQIQKGIEMEEDAITLLSNTLEKPLFKWKRGRVYNKFFQGEPDVVVDEAGFDTKCSWSLQTFPFPGDDNEDVYEWQNQIYMSLLDKEVWYTVKCLTNTNARLLDNAKKNWFYSMGSPDPGTEEWEAYLLQAKEVEKDSIFDLPRFIKYNPNYTLDHEIDEWEFDIPPQDRIIFFKTERDELKIKEAEERVVMAREYLNNLTK